MLKGIKNKNILAGALIILVLLLIIFLPSSKKQSESREEPKKEEIYKTQDYEPIFDRKNKDSPESVTPDNLIDKIILEITGGDSETFCSTKEDGTKYNLNDREGYKDKSIYLDLNSDGADEIIIEPIEVCGFIIRGASGNGPFYIFQKEGEEWVKIGELNGNLIRVSKEKTNGYFKINTNYHLSAKSGFDTFYEYVPDENEAGLGSYIEVFRSDYDNAE